MRSSRPVAYVSSTVSPEVAGRGKGPVLNEGYRVLSELLERDDPLVAGFDPDEVVVGIVDADGTLEPDALASTSRGSFADPRVGGVQMGVIIGNAERRPDRALPGPRVRRVQPPGAGGPGPHRLRRARR